MTLLSKFEFGSKLFHFRILTSAGLAGDTACHSFFLLIGDCHIFSEEMLHQLKVETFFVSGLECLPPSKHVCIQSDSAVFIYFCASVQRFL